ncbi:helix-turn-helix domain-containing protein [Denitrificimonas caeni]|uniref:helix-turn-helix domain-containing protein n=1 Tax=Denitrificimonas caeni TaxID=521720 RepID=UPI0019639B76|nr:helix-turn-helix transcriptional regulator [Denitrificimonas caeni]
MIKILREYLGLSLSEVSFAVGIDQQFIQDIEDEKLTPNFKLINFYSDRTGISAISIKKIVMYSGDGFVKGLIIKLMYKYIEMILYLKK